MNEEAPAPFRIAFDNARDPYAARNALGIAGNAVTSATAPLSITGGTISIDLSAYAPLASPTFTGDPKSVTPAAGDNDTSIATTAFVQTAIAGSTVLGLRVFTVSGTYTPTAGMRTCIIELVGGGGGGGGVTGASALVCGGGGGGGGYAKKFATAATIGASQTVTIGAQGAGGSSGSSGGNGGTTSVGSLCVAAGGIGGGGSSGSSAGQGGQGGGGTTGDIIPAGQGGGYGSIGANPPSMGSGFGGSSLLSGGAAVAFGSGTNAGGYGAGGAGCLTLGSNGTGGNGSAGVVIITEFG